MLVRIGIVGKAHGLRGEVTVFPTSDDPGLRFQPDTEVRLNGQPIRIIASRPHGDAWLISFAGITDRSAAETLRGQEIFLDVEESLIADEYYDQELVARRVLRADGTEAGVIESIQHFPAQDLIVVRTSSGTRLVPFVRELVPVVTEDFVQIAEIRGLLDEEE